MRAATLDDVTAEGAVVRLNGVDLFVRRLGDRDLPALVVIHGGPSWDHSYLLPALAELVDTAHVVLFDLRGCGRSHRTPPLGDLPESELRPHLLADDVAALVDALGTGPVDVLGFSYGGRIAMRLVQRHPEVVDRLILASTTAYTDFDSELAASADYQQRRRLCTEVGFDDPLLTGPAAPDGALSRAMADAEAPLQVWRLDRLDRWREVLDRVRFSSDYDRPYLSGSWPPGGPENAAEVLSDWGRPVLILHGQKEMSFPLETARRLHAVLPASTLAEIPDAAHMAHFDNPAEWLAAIRRFLRPRRSPLGPAAAPGAV
ncbi:alpha/beta hydrolase [Actinoplanes oblitus]|uniref:Alpha/beta hydrolase n=1 Tax=Actinoplanes oblitus TaxID=3040509 RepID=A0ABY8W644_9ACTN|nr:alpha/beta hydrolase [Actinoplanes oblitus]WIM92493.1 alpha/beta hydrolase [Actinoplanes oblitus]